jgi:hypothetical protein
MPGLTGETFIPTKYMVGGRVVGGTMRRKNGIRTLPVAARAVPLPARAEPPALPPHPPPPLEVEDLPPAKRARLQTSDSSSAAADRVTTDSPDDTPTDPVTPSVSLPSAAASRAPRRTWKPEEDAKLTEVVKKLGKKWVAVAKLVPGRSNIQCRIRWAHTLDPANGKSAGKWKPEEDTQMAQAVKKHGKHHWVAVAAMVSGRTDKQCRERWVNTVDPTNGKKAGQWTPEEDARLTEAVKKHGKDRWVAVAAMVLGRMKNQCRERWTQTLDPTNVKKGKWTPEEDAKLTAAVKEYGKHWVEVAAMVPGRINNQCRQRWIKSLDPDRVLRKITTTAITKRLYDRMAYFN